MNEFAAACRERGLWPFVHFNRTHVVPPCTTTAEEIREEILSEHGFGPYAAEGLLRVLGRHDYLALDSWVRQEYCRRYPGPRRTTDRAIARRYARYGAHRGLALWLDMTSHWHETPSKA